ncbi:hypothetical protein ACFMQL_16465 [Nonomuraea fastidiosa]|uniref:hypothetical protein n=1 Tax=Nonomuraea fastidiosa TaxID=46173 RepID=UPI003672F894
MAGRPPHSPADAPYEVIAAVRDNAAWCDLMCRAHGRPGTFAERAWTNPARTPLYYPDAVTLSPLATAADVLPHIDAGSGASVKDSFATLDLPGFEVLFEAQWIHRAAPEPAETSWQVVEDAATLAAWAAACGLPDLFPPALLTPAATDAATGAETGSGTGSGTGAATGSGTTTTIVYGRTGGAITEGAVLTSTGDVVGVSNVFGPASAWAGVTAMAARLFPGRPLVGYESDPSDALAHGFTTTGPLRILLKP